MPATARAFVALIVVVVGLILAPGGLLCAAPSPRTSDSELSIPFPGTSVRMRTRVIRPPGAGPFPLAVISHGSTEDEAVRASQVVSSYRGIVGLLVELGYLVAIPQRPGHGETGGVYLEGAGDCDSPDYGRSGHATAKSIHVTIDYMMQQPYVRKVRVVLVGHSAGAWGSLALASRFQDLVESVINFAGGRGGHSYDQPNTNCSPDRLVEAAGDFGRTTRVPTLWVYASNDSYFAPALVQRMADAYRNAGGSAELRMLPPTGDEGHFALQTAESLWRPIVATFLRKHHTAGSLAR